MPYDSMTKQKNLNNFSLSFKKRTKFLLGKADSFLNIHWFKKICIFKTTKISVFREIRTSQPVYSMNNH